MISTEMQSTSLLSFLTIRKVKRSQRASTAKNPSGRPLSQLELVSRPIGRQTCQQQAFMEHPERFSVSLTDDGQYRLLIEARWRKRDSNPRSPVRETSILEPPVRALSVPLILYLCDKLGVADLGRPAFEILGGFVVLLCQTTEQGFQIVLPRHLGQMSKMVCALAIVRNVGHTFETARSG